MNNIIIFLPFIQMWRNSVNNNSCCQRYLYLKGLYVKIFFFFFVRTDFSLRESHHLLATNLAIFLNRCRIYSGCITFMRRHLQISQSGLICIQSKLLNWSQSQPGDRSLRGVSSLGKSAHIWYAHNSPACLAPALHVLQMKNGPLNNLCTELLSI